MKTKKVNTKKTEVKNKVKVTKPVKKAVAIKTSKAKPKVKKTTAIKEKKAVKSDSEVELASDLSDDNLSDYAPSPASSYSVSSPSVNSTDSEATDSSSGSEYGRKRRRSGSKKKHRCPICLSFFSSDLSLEKHVENIHNKDHKKDKKAADKSKNARDIKKSLLAAVQTSKTKVYLVKKAAGKKKKEKFSTKRFRCSKCSWAGGKHEYLEMHLNTWHTTTTRGGRDLSRPNYRE